VRYEDRHEGAEANVGLEDHLGSVHRAVSGGAQHEASTNQEHAAVCWHVVTGAAALSGADAGQQSVGVLQLASFLPMGADIHEPTEAIEVVRDVALDSMFEYLDEQLDGRNALLGLLLEYKQRCEFILGQGVDFTVEPVRVFRCLGMGWEAPSVQAV
jgi:hypothetical protein